MASILFLDDCPTRTDWARRRLSLPTDLFKSVETAAMAIRFLGESPVHFDTVYLDHDLGGETWQDPDDKNTGSEVVRWIVLNRPRIGRVFVHSMNTPAGNRMADNLRQAGYDAQYRSWLTIVNENR
jgi:hypothetical protein